MSLNGEMTAANSVEEILTALNSWANSVTFTTYEMEQGRPTNSLEWLHDVGIRIDHAVNILRQKLT